MLRGYVCAAAPAPRAAALHGRGELVHTPDGARPAPEEYKQPTTHDVSSQGVTMALFPLHFFFTALYYTDTGSTLLVIGAHLLALRGQYLAAGLAAAAATGFRQTNAVWAAFTLAVRRVCRASRPLCLLAGWALLTCFGDPVTTCICLCSSSVPRPLHAAGGSHAGVPRRH